MPAKPLIYIETSAISYLTARPSRNVISAARQKLTYLWWQKCLPEYVPVISSEVLREAARGNREAAERRMAMLRGMTLLADSGDIDIMAEKLLANGAIPEKAEEDARHLATCAVHRIPCLVTWNFKHISNPQMWACMRRICEQAGHSFPAIIRLGA